MITLIDYKAGNLTSVRKAFTFLGEECVVTEDPALVRDAQALVLPGVGHFCTTERLATSGVRDAVLEAISRGVPFLGICVGMQVLFESSDEFGGDAGLGIFAGHVRRFAGAPRVPHMGWNDLTIVGEHPFVAGLRGGEFAYFLHSYRVADSDATVASADYGGRFAAIVARDNVMATQFHPEKSQRTGAVLLDNFLALAA